MSSTDSHTDSGAPLTEAHDEEFENEAGLPLLVHATNKRRLAKKEIPWVECAGPGCTKTISPEAAQRTKYCGLCQMREKEVRLEVTDLDLTESDIAFLWQKRNFYRISEAAKFLGLKTRTLYALVSKGRIRASRSQDGCLVISRPELLLHGRHLKGVIGLKEAAEAMEVDYGYLRELVRRNVLKAETTFWGHYGLKLVDLSNIKRSLSSALPATGDFNLVSFSERLGVHHSLVQKWIKQGKIHANKGLTGRITIPGSEMERFIRLVSERQRFLPTKVRERILSHIDGDSESPEGFGGEDYHRAS